MTMSTPSFLPIAARHLSSPPHSLRSADSALSMSRRFGSGCLSRRSSSLRNSVSSRATSSGSMPSASNRQTAIFTLSSAGVSACSSQARIDARTHALPYLVSLRTTMNDPTIARLHKAVLACTHMMLRRWVLAALLCSCSSVSTVRVQPENVYAGAHMRPIAVIHAQVTSAYLLFIGIPGNVDLDHVVNRMLIAAAKALGA